MQKKIVQEVFEILKKYYSKNELIELKYKNDYTLLIAVLLSAQATDKGVNKATNELFEIADTPEKMLKLGENGVKEFIKTINYYNNKAKNIIKLSQILVEKFNSKIPTTREDLENLAGVGRKTTNIILNIVYNIPNIAVDTHVFRVSNRIGLTKAKNVLESEKQLLKIVPKDYISFVNHWLVLLGRYVCQARKPKCENCPIEKLCLKQIKNN